MSVLGFFCLTIGTLICFSCDLSGACQNYFLDMETFILSNFSTNVFVFVIFSFILLVDQFMSVQGLFSVYSLYLHCALLNSHACRVGMCFFVELGGIF